MSVIPSVFDQADREEYEANRKVLDSVMQDRYPPTNPSVLMRAARYIYLHQNLEWGIKPHRAIMLILTWVLDVMVRNSQDIPQDFADATIVLTAMAPQLLRPL